ncbi:bola-like protein [Xylariaceae sp. FL0016]|nr:bola-like protein [Xylariaceae sp. FL0016]
MLCIQCRRLATAAARRQIPSSSSRCISSATTSSFAARNTSQRPFLSRPVTQSPRHTLVSSAPYAISFSSSATARSSTAAPDPPQVPEKPDYLNDAESAIWDKLSTEFAPTELMVQDISGGCGSMYGIEIASDKFRGLNMLKQQRMVNAALGEQIKSWHGVQLRTKIP